MEKIIILGKGGHAKSIVDAIERQGIYEIAGYVVNEESEIGQKDYPVIGKDEDLDELYQSGIHNVAIGIGFLGRSTIRKRIYNHLKEIGYSFPIICDTSAVVSKKAIIEEGTFIGKCAVVNSGAKIGKMCIVNTGAIVEHDCHVGDFSHIAVGTVLCGDVHIGCETLVGANATVIQGRSVGDRYIIGAGEVVRKDMEDNRMCNDKKAQIVPGGVISLY